MPRLPCKTTLQLALTPSKRKAFAASPIDTAASKRAFRARPSPFFTLCRGFHQVSSHLTRCHACHGICTLSPLDAALTMRFAKNMQHDTSKVLRLPRKMTMDTSKVCTCHENCNSSCENVAKVLHLPQKTTFDTLQNTSECHEGPRLPRETKQRDD